MEEKAKRAAGKRPLCGQRDRVRERPGGDPMDGGAPQHLEGASSE